MHDIDRTQAETWETYEYGPAEFGYESGEMYGEEESSFEDEYLGEYMGEQEEEDEVWGEAEYTGEAGYMNEYAMEGPLGEAMEMELAAELLEINSEEELDQFLGKLIKRVGRTVGGIIRSPIGRALGGALKGVAKRFLPIVGGALGSIVAPGIGTALGSSLGSAAGRAFGLEPEGLSAEDQEFEVARQYVRLATAAAQQAAMAPNNVSAQVAARQALTNAAQQFAPGILTAPRRPTQSMGMNGMGGMQGMNGMTGPQGVSNLGRRPRARTGRWVRQGRNIVLLDMYRR